MNKSSEDRDMNEEGTLERVGEQLGGAAGRAMGRGAEIAGGMMGSMVDSLINTLGDWWSSTDAETAARGFDRADPACRQHFDNRSASEQTSSTSSRTDYEDARPFYQFGYVASRNPSYQGRDFTEIEPDLRTAWTGDSTGEDWSDVRGYVDFGYTRDRMDNLDL
jgi:hypothetical protein